MSMRVIIESLEPRVMLTAAGFNDASSAFAAASEPAIIRTTSWDTETNEGTGSTDLLGQSFAAEFLPRHTLQVEGAGLFAVETFEWGAERPRNVPIIDELRLTLGMTTDSPGFLLAALSGHVYEQMELISRDAAGREQVRWRLENVVVSSYGPVGVPAPGDVPLEQITLRFNALELTYTHRDPVTGGVLAVNAGSWDFASNTGTGGAFGGLTFAPGDEPEHMLDLGGTQIALDAFTWEQSFLPAGPGQVVPAEFEFVAPMSLASPGLLVSMLKGTKLPEVVVSSRDSEGFIYSEWKLQGAVIKSWRGEAGDGRSKMGDGESQIDSFTVAFDIIEQTVHQLDADKGIIVSRTSSWDTVTGARTGSKTLSGESFPQEEEPTRTLEAEGEGLIALEAIEAPVVGGQVGGITIALPMSVNSPGFLVGSDTNYDTMVLVRRDEQGRELVRWTMTNAMITGYQTGSGSGGEMPVERVTLGMFEELRIDSHRYGAGDEPIESSSSTWRAKDGWTGLGDFGSEQLVGPLRPGHRLDLGEAHLEVLAHEWSASTSGGTAPQLNEATFVVLPSVASAGLAAAAGAGTLFPQFVLSSFKEGQEKAFLEVTFHEVIITAHQVIDLRIQTVERFSIAYSGVQMSYGEQTTSWDGQGPPTGDWNIKRPMGAAGAEEVASFEFRLVSETHGSQLATYNSQLSSPRHTLQADGGDLIPLRSIGWSQMIPPGGVVEIGEVRVMADTMELSPNMLYAMLAERHYAQMVLVTRDDAGREIVRWELENAAFSSYGPRFESGMVEPLDEFTLRFEKITLTWTEYDADGNVVATNSGSYNLSTGVGGGGFGGSVFPPGDAPRHMIELHDLNPAQVGAMSFDWGVSRPAGGAAAIGQFHVDAPMGLASPGILAHAATRKGQPKPVVFTSRDALGRIVAQWTMSGALFGSYGATMPEEGAEDGDPVDRFGLRFGAIEFTYFDYPPVVTAAEFDRQVAPHGVSFTFSEDVSAAPSVGDLVVENLTTGATIGAADLMLSYDPAGRTATFTYTGSAGLLPDGLYRATLLASGIRDGSGNAMVEDFVFDFFYLAGDANGDGRVNIGDLSILAGNWQQSVFGPANGDFNYDGVVNVSDLSILAGNWQVDLQSSGFRVQGSGLDVERSTLDVERSEQVAETSTAQRSTFNVQEAKRGGGAFGDQRPGRLVKPRLGEIFSRVSVARPGVMPPPWLGSLESPGILEELGVEERDEGIIRSLIVL